MVAIEMGKGHYFIISGIFLIGIHSLQDWTVTTRHEVTK